MRRLICSLFLLLALSALPAAAGERIALVVGIDDYKSLRDLANPVIDARAVAELFKKNGYRVIERYDSDFVDLHDALADIENSDADEVVIYFAGHGFAIDKADILAPADVDFDCEKRTARRFIRLDELLERIERIPNKIVLLDACRNDPFPTCPKRGAEESSFRGLSLIGPNHSGLLIASSTLSGKLAADGASGTHSPFASAFLRRAAENPTLLLSDVINLTSRDVARELGNAQVPEVIIRGGAPEMCLAAEGCGRPQQQASLEDNKTPPPAETCVEAPVGQGTRCLARGDTFRDCPDCPEMVVVPPGKFAMGPAWAERDGPQSDITLAKPFAVGKFEVTVDQYAAFVADSGYDAGNTCDTYSDDGPKQVEGLSWRNPGFAQTGSDPAVCINWEDARAYAAWLSKRTGREYRLPSDAEWEYAARGGTGSITHLGDPKKGVCGYANVADLATRKAPDWKPLSSTTSCLDGYPHTSPAGSLAANPFGLHDMLGNAWEWVADEPDGTASAEIKPLPADGSPVKGDWGRVQRGGSWQSMPTLQSSGDYEGYTFRQRSDSAGFRVTRTLP